MPKINNGYKMIKISNHPFSNSDGYIYEHRLLMELHIGRNLSPSERVHHINGIKTDNRIENLELFKNSSQHMRNRHPKKFTKPGPQCPRCNSSQTGSRGKKSYYCHNCNRTFSKNGKYIIDHHTVCPRCSSVNIISKGTCFKCKTCSRSWLKNSSRLNR